MEQITRSMTPQYQRLDRAFQNIQRPPDFNNQLAQVRVIYGTNLTRDGQLKTSVGPKTKDDVFTIRVEYNLAPRGHGHLRLVLQGSDAEQAVKEGLKVGDFIHFDAHVNGMVNEEGRLIRMPVAYATWYERVESKSPEQEKVLQNESAGNMTRSPRDIPGVERI